MDKKAITRDNDKNYNKDERSSNNGDAQLSNQLPVVDTEGTYAMASGVTLTGMLKQGVELADANTDLDEALHRRPPTGTKGVVVADNAFRLTTAARDSIESIRLVPLTQDFQRLGAFCAYFQATIKDGSALIDSVYLAQLVPMAEEPQDIPESHINKMRLPIQLVGGQPLLEGIPIWERLEGERIDFYNLFKIYRDMKYTVMDSGRYLVRTRAVGALIRAVGLPGKMIQVLAQIYHWDVRVQAFDNFMDLEIQKVRYMETTQLMDKHLAKADELVDLATNRLKTAVGSMPPKDIINLLELGLKYSRLSLNLPSDKPITDGKPTSIAVHSTTISSNDQILQVNNGSETMSQFAESIKKPDTILSILGVLQRSGAIDNAIGSLEGGIVDDASFNG